ncbi:MAG: ferric iron uptake transcriptional regulator [Duodenibacillus sp.]|nr:ferric iron uptake transcriptional regulator [Duodenibacillus sp.]
MSPSKAAAKQGERRSEKELKSAGLKATGPRMRILELFEDALVNGPNRHLTAEDVYKQLVAEEFDVGLATVYRVLSQFESAGLIVRRYFGNDRATYEMDDGSHHDHIVCTRCGRVEEFVDEEIERRQREIAHRLGFELEDHALSLYGICEECRKKEKAHRT